MPTYVYETIPADVAEAPRRFEIEQRMSEAPLQRDPETGLPVRRVITGGLGFIAPSDPSAAPVCGQGGCGIPACEAMAQAAPRPHSCHPGCDH